MFDQTELEFGNLPLGPGIWNFCIWNLIPTGISDIYFTFGILNERKDHREKSSNS